MSLIELVANSENTRIDVFIASNVNDITRAYASTLIKEEKVRCNGKIITKSHKVKIGDIVQIEMPQPKELEIVPQNISLDIVFEDEDVIIINKPKAMVVHPAAGNYDKTLVNALLYHCKGNLSAINGVLRPGIVHRIDKDTSGLIICAKNNSAHNFLAKQFEAHTIKREYHAIVYGNFKVQSGAIQGNIARHPIDRKRMALTENGGKFSHTNYEVIAQYKNYSHIKATLKTGRTHQIRVHMASIAHPLAGDAVYGPKKIIKSLNGQCLHAKNLGFIHPKTNENMLFESELPPYFTAFLNKINVL